MHEVLVRISLYLQLQPNRKIHNLLSLHIQLTVVLKSDVERMMSGLEHLETSVGGFAVTINSLTSIVFGLQEREDFIEVSCIELEHFGFPVLPAEISVQVVGLNAEFEHVFVEVKSSKVLETAVDTKSNDRYSGLRGR